MVFKCISTVFEQIHLSEIVCSTLDMSIRLCEDGYDEDQSFDQPQGAKILAELSESHPRHLQSLQL